MRTSLHSQPLRRPSAISNNADNANAANVAASNDPPVKSENQVANEAGTPSRRNASRINQISPHDEVEFMTVPGGQVHPPSSQNANVETSENDRSGQEMNQGGSGVGNQNSNNVAQPVPSAKEEKLRRVVEIVEFLSGIPWSANASVSTRRHLASMEEAFDNYAMIIRHLVEIYYLVEKERKNFNCDDLKHLLKSLQSGILATSKEASTAQENPVQPQNEPMQTDEPDANQQENPSQPQNESMQTDEPDVNQQEKQERSIASGSRSSMGRGRGRQSRGRGSVRKSQGRTEKPAEPEEQEIPVESGTSMRRGPGQRSSVRKSSELRSEDSGEQEMKVQSGSRSSTGPGQRSSVRKLSQLTSGDSGEREMQVESGSRSSIGPERRSQLRSGESGEQEMQAESGSRTSMGRGRGRTPGRRSSVRKSSQLTSRDSEEQEMQLESGSRSSIGPGQRSQLTSGDSEEQEIPVESGSRSSIGPVRRSQLTSGDSGEQEMQVASGSRTSMGRGRGRPGPRSSVRGIQRGRSGSSARLISTRSLGRRSTRSSDRGRIKSWKGRPNFRGRSMSLRGRPNSRGRSMSSRGRPSSRGRSMSSRGRPSSRGRSKSTGRKRLNTDEEEQERERMNKIYIREWVQEWLWDAIPAELRARHGVGMPTLNVKKMSSAGIEAAKAKLKLSSPSHPQPSTSRQILQPTDQVSGPSYQSGPQPPTSRQRLQPTDQMAGPSHKSDLQPPTSRQRLQPIDQVAGPSHQSDPQPSTSRKGLETIDESGSNEKKRRTVDHSGQPSSKKPKTDAPSRFLLQMGRIGTSRKVTEPEIEKLQTEEESDEEDVNTKLAGNAKGLKRKKKKGGRGRPRKKGRPNSKKGRK